MISPNAIPLGATSIKRFQRIAQTYQQIGLVESVSDVDLEKFIYNPIEDELHLTSTEKRWLVTLLVVVFVAVLIIFIVLLISNRRLERKVNERTDAYRRESSRLQAILENASDGIHILSISGQLMRYSDSFARMLGYLPNEMSELNVMNWECGITQEQFENNAKVLIEKPITFETQHRRKDGSMLEVEINAKSITLDHQTYIYASSRDITERKKIENALKASEIRFRSIIDMSPVPMALNDNQQNITFLNSSFTQTFGYDLNDIPTLAKWWQKAYPDPIYREWVINTWNDALQKAQANNVHFTPIEFIIQCKDGTKKTVIVSATVAESIENTHLVILHDITERKENEVIMLKAQKAAESLAKSKSEFLANMSHEIRTPMNAIIGLSKLALNKEMPSEIRDYLEKINTSSESLLGILNDILDFSKIEAGKLVIEKTNFNIVVMLRTLRNLFVSHAENKNLQFHVDIDVAIPSNLIGDVSRLQQILSNLLGNAIKFTQQGEITLKLELLETDDSMVKVRFSVRDTGIGISVPDQEKLFKPFSQVDTSITRRFGGTGLGLAISHNLLQLMGSHLQLDSVLGQGTTFFFDLSFNVASNKSQKMVAPKNAMQYAGGLSEKLQKKAQSLKSTRILVAEDNLINQQVIREFLKLSGVEVEIANNGLEALQCLKNNTYDLILMDVHMPDMDGTEATKQIRQQSIYTSLPIIALTAGVTMEERENCINSGMNDLINKPINPEELVAVLSYWITKSKN